MPAAQARGCRPTILRLTRRHQATGSTQREDEEEAYRNPLNLLILRNDVNGDEPALPDPSVGRLAHVRWYDRPVSSPWQRTRPTTLRAVAADGRTGAPR